MCGIIGFTGKLDAVEVLLNGLSELEYRGYDSAGIAYFHGSRVETIKTAGKVKCLADKASAVAPAGIHCGIGHTRWATHGGVSDLNSHPHTCGRVTLIHNGIIENYQTLQAELAEAGKEPISQTDTEIAAMVLEQLYEGNPVTAIRQAVKRLTGAYAFCILFADHPDTIYAIRSGSPLVASHVGSGSVIASDMVALLKYSKDYFVVPENHITILTPEEILVTDMEGNQVIPEMLHVSWDVSAAKKGGFEHFMLKEIFDQPDSLRNTIVPRIVDGLPDFEHDGIPDELFTGARRIIISACGTAMHAGLLGRSLMERLLRIPVTVEIASEFRYQDPIVDEQTLLITVSQSGETADSLAAIRLAKEKGAKTFSIVNVKGSSIARESDYVLYTHAGPEIAVASTKAYSVQVACLYLVAFRWAYILKKRPEEEIRHAMDQMLKLPSLVSEVLSHKQDIEEISRELKTCENLFFIGRGLDYALSCEGSLKLKEVSYIHSESYAAGELKHGTISLITDNVPVIALATQSGVYTKMVSNIVEVRSRGAMVIMITGHNAPIESTLCDHQIRLPEVDDLFAPFCAIPILQFIAYYAALQRGVNVDQPRNLAKSVTVE
ncbi:glutamine--fructose-6-phosphate transaminase (isomerizing) [Anaerolentibacter hominis]|uniref:glutamine--fructose-6-phosphate transaminase (isomerizing) n=1 Tax=Anaerolentibacter hominis TaxID=3079009 RepID=UPI0031B866E5